MMMNVSGLQDPMDNSRRMEDLVYTWCAVHSDFGWILLFGRELCRKNCEVCDNWQLVSPVLSLEETKLAMSILQSSVNRLGSNTM